MIIGGFKGISTEHFLTRIKSVRKIHVYEPVPAFFTELTERIKDSKVATGFNQAIFEGENLTLDLSGDASLIRDTGRLIPDHLPKAGVIQVDSLSLRLAVERILSEGAENEYSLYMNCEGSEYQILEEMLVLGTLAKSIVFQTHISGSQPYEKLYHLRSLLAKHYIPVLTTDWAWDVWVRRDYISRSPASLEQDPL